jgi:hypothetical protein
MNGGRDEARQQQAAEAHAAHERPEQHADGDRGRANHQFEQLKPDDFVDECSAATADKQQQQRGQQAPRVQTDLLNTRNDE